MDALVLAGGELETERFTGLDPSVRRKAQIPVLGRPMVEWTVAAVRSCTGVKRIVVVGDESLATRELRDLNASVVPEGAGIADNLRAGLAALPGAAGVIAVSADLPLVTRAGLEDLMTNAPAADVVFPYVERKEIIAAFPDREWIFAQTPEGAFTGGAAGLFRCEPVLANWNWVEQLLEARRKSVLGLAAMIGPVFAVKYLLHRLRVADVERKLSALLHLEGRGYCTCFAELAMDVDKFSDVALVEDVLRAREQPGGAAAG
jgi:CTP:molybdopterin cytidylyltransferase MocA